MIVNTINLLLLPGFQVRGSILLLAVAVFLLALLSYKRLVRLDNPQQMYNFDVNNTLPIRGILALLIVALHIGLEFPDSFFDLFYNFGAPVVAVFFFCSGYGLTVSYMKGGGYLSGFFKKRFSKILPLFVVLTLISGLYSIIFHGDSLFDVFVVSLLHGNTPLPFSWFMYAIIYFYITFYLSCKYMSTIKYAIFCQSLMTVAYMLLLHYAHFKDFWVNAAISFPLGMYVAGNERTIKSYLCRYPMIVFGYLVVSSLLILNFRYAVYGLIGEIVSFNLVALDVLVGVYLFGCYSSRFLRFLGNISLEIYLLHGIVFMSLYAFHFNWWQFAISCYALSIFMASAWRYVIGRIEGRRIKK